MTHPEQKGGTPRLPLRQSTGIAFASAPMKSGWEKEGPRPLAAARWELEEASDPDAELRRLKDELKPDADKG